MRAADNTGHQARGRTEDSSSSSPKPIHAPSMMSISLEGGRRERGSAGGRPRSGFTRSEYPSDLVRDQLGAVASEPGEVLLWGASTAAVQVCCEAGSVEACTHVRSGMYACASTCVEACTHVRCAQNWLRLPQQASNRWQQRRCDQQGGWHRQKPGRQSLLDAILSKPARGQRLRRLRCREEKAGMSESNKKRTCSPVMAYARDGSVEVPFEHLPFDVLRRRQQIPHGLVGTHCRRERHCFSHALGPHQPHFCVTRNRFVHLRAACWPRTRSFMNFRGSRWHSR